MQDGVQRRAPQLVVHRHILVDGQTVDRPSFRVKPGQLIHVKAKSEGTPSEECSAAARILAIADAYDSMVSDQVYRKRRDFDDAFAELRASVRS